MGTGLAITCGLLLAGHGAYMLFRQWKRGLLAEESDLQEAASVHKELKVK